MKKPDAGQVYQALIDSIELRWKPLKDGIPLPYVPTCKLCYYFRELRESTTCKNCPLFLIGDACIKYEPFMASTVSNPYSTYDRWRRAPRDNRRAEAQAMIDQLQKCLDTFFPAGLAKEES